MISPNIKQAPLREVAMPMRVAIAVPTVGRASLLTQVAPHWLDQTRPANRVVVAFVRDEDVAGLSEVCPEIEFVRSHGDGSLCAQRNSALDYLAGDCDIVIFFDDDFIPSRTFVENTIALLEQNPDIAASTGMVLADGINTPGIDYSSAVARVVRYDAKTNHEHWTHELKHTYGCNMALRMSLNPALRFDERLPLYSWQEDLDFSRRLAAGRRIVRTSDVAGVHMGHKKGRVSGVRLGYSQIANPIYLNSKNVMSKREVLVMASKNVLKNMARSLWPEPWIDRRGRLKGNVIALMDWLRGDLKPERILEL